MFGRAVFDHTMNVYGRALRVRRMCAGFLAGVIADIVSAASCLLLSQVFPHVLDPPPAAHMGEPNQVHSLTSLKTTWEMDVTDA